MHIPVPDNVRMALGTNGADKIPKTAPACSWLMSGKSNELYKRCLAELKTLLRLKGWEEFPMIWVTDMEAAERQVRSVIFFRARKKLHLNEANSNAWEQNCIRRALTDRLCYFTNNRKQAITWCGGLSVICFFHVRDSIKRWLDAHGYKAAGMKQASFFLKEKIKAMMYATTEVEFEDAKDKLYDILDAPGNPYKLVKQSEVVFPLLFCLSNFWFNLFGYYCDQWKTKS